MNTSQDERATALAHNDEIEKRHHVFYGMGNDPDADPKLAAERRRFVSPDEAFKLLLDPETTAPADRLRPYITNDGVVIEPKHDPFISNALHSSQMQFYHWLLSSMAVNAPRMHIMTPGSPAMKSADYAEIEKRMLSFYGDCTEQEERYIDHLFGYEPTYRYYPIYEASSPDGDLKRDKRRKKGKMTALDRQQESADAKKAMLARCAKMKSAA